MEKYLIVYAKEDTATFNALGQDITIPATQIYNEVVELKTDKITEKVVEGIEEYLEKEVEFRGWGITIINIIKLKDNK